MKSNDGLLKIEVMKKASEAVFPSFDVAIFPLMETESDHKDFMKALYQSQNDKQILLLIPKGEKSNKLKQLSYLKTHKPWKFIDSVAITYDRPGQSNGNCAIQLADYGFLYYKGVQSPHLGNTRWFRDAYANAGNHFDLGVMEGEERQYTQYNKFSAELIMLLVSMSFPIQVGRVLYGFGNLDLPALKFIKSGKIEFHVYLNNNENAVKIIEQYDALE